MGESIDEILTSRFKGSEAVGAAFSLFNQGNFHTFCYGLQAISGPPITENSIFELGSITKLFTTSILMNLVDRKVVSLLDPLERFLPFLGSLRSKIREITLEHLATHHSGLPNFPANFAPKDDQDPYREYDVQALYGFLMSSSAKKVRQNRFEYSNLGVGLLGYVLCLATQSTYEQLVADEIFNPLKMRDTSSSPLLKNSAELCQGYFLKRPVPNWNFTEVFAGAMSARSSLKDMQKFFIANFVTGSFSKCHLIRRPIDRKESVGLGWIIDHSRKENIIWHDGITTGFQSWIGFNPKQQRGIVALANASADWILPLSFEILTSCQELIPAKSAVGLE